MTAKVAETQLWQQNLASLIRSWLFSRASTGDLNGLFSGFDGFDLNAFLLRQHPNCDELVFDLLERREHRLSVRADACLVSCARRCDLRVGEAAIEQSLGER